MDKVQRCRERRNKILKFRITTLAVVGMLTLSGQLAFADVSSGLVTYWPLDEEKPVDVTPEVISEILSQVIDGADAADFVGVADSARIFKNVGAFAPNGDGDWIKVTDDDVLDITKSLTIAGWVFLSDLDNEFSLFDKDPSTTDAITEIHYGVNVRPTSGFINWVVQFDTFNAVTMTLVLGNAAGCGAFGPDTRNCMLQGTEEIEPLSWAHIVSVYDHENGTMLLYLDGVLIGKALLDVPAGVELLPNDNAISIGRRQRTIFGGPGADGRIDDIRLYNRALSAFEVRKLYESVVEVDVEVASKDFDASESDTFDAAVLSNAVLAATTDLDEDTLRIASPLRQMLAAADAPPRLFAKRLMSTTMDFLIFSARFL